jgi:DNA-binding transcriptional LysR family regulator
VDTRHLEAFIAVVDIGSFTRAAVRLDLSQSTVTTRIKMLEQSLGATLLERLPRGVKATTAGAELVPYARQIIALSERAQYAISSGGQPHGRVDVGTIECLTNHRLLPLIEYLYLRYPKIQLSLHSPRDADAVSLVRDGHLDCAFVIDAMQDHEDLETRVLCPEPLVLVGGHGHTLLDRADITPDDLRGATLVKSDNCAAYHARFERTIGLPDAVDGVRMFELDSISAAKRSVANGMGMALMPKVSVSDELADGTLRPIPWTPPFDTYTQVVWRRHNGSNAALTALVSAAVQVVQEQLDD